MTGLQRVFLHYRGEYVHLPDGETIVGRDLGCRLRFNDAGVSRRHFCIRVADGTAKIQDLGSTNGTKVNHEKITGESPLSHRDKIQVGGRELTVYFLDEEEGLDGLETSTMVDVTPPPRRKQNTPRRLQIDGLVRARKQTCAQCGASVLEGDQHCRSCGYAWSDFTPSAKTSIGMPDQDRRRHSRKQISIPVLYSSDSLEVQSVAKNLSLTGVFISTEFQDLLGTECKVVVMVDGGPAVELVGRVARVVPVGHPEGVPAGVAVEFESMDEGARQWLWRTLRRQMGDLGQGVPE